jgi:hypothetical protein
VLPSSIAYALRSNAHLARRVARCPKLSFVAEHTIRTGSGGVHRLDAYREWLADIGFKPPEIHELLGDFPLKLIIARKSGGRSLGAASR